MVERRIYKKIVDCCSRCPNLDSTERQLSCLEVKVTDMKLSSTTYDGYNTGHRKIEIDDLNKIQDWCPLEKEIVNG